MRNHKDRSKRLLVYSVIFSLVAHVSFMTVKFKLFDKVAKKLQAEEKIRIALKSKKSDKKLNKIVATEKNKNNLEVESKYLSQYNNSVERQTKAQNLGTTKKAGLGNSKKVAAQEQKKQKEVKKVTKRKVTRRSKKAKKVSFKDFAFTKKTTDIREAQRLVKGIKSGSKKFRGLGSSNDLLDDVPLGDMTQLNTKEYKYYGFYFRIRQKLEQYWGQSLREKMEAFYKRGGRFPASDKHLTSVRVIMDSKGKIVDVVIKSSSGISELDEAAVEAFNSAGPFPNPPTGMIKNGKASVEWGFSVSS